jgi:hypothetical protein
MWRTKRFAKASESPRSKNSETRVLIVLRLQDSALVADGGGAWVYLGSLFFGWPTDAGRFH